TASGTSRCSPVAATGLRRSDRVPCAAAGGGIPPGQPLPIPLSASPSWPRRTTSSRSSECLGEFAQCPWIIHVDQFDWLIIGPPEEAATVAFLFFSYRAADLACLSSGRCGPART